MKTPPVNKRRANLAIFEKPEGGRFRHGQNGTAEFGIVRNTK
jgi:hypothetical protein